MNELDETILLRSIKQITWLQSDLMNGTNYNEDLYQILEVALNNLEELGSLDFTE